MPRDMSRMKRGADIDAVDIIGCDEDRECIHLDHEGIIRTTEKAALLKIDGEEKWIPKSQIMDASDSTLAVTTWFAEKEGWV